MVESETKLQLISKLQGLTNHQHIKLTTRGNTAIRAAVSAVGKVCGNSKCNILIPEEGGWLEYKKIKNVDYVKCNDAKINMDHLREKLSTNNIKTFLYQNPGGYFAEQPMEKIYHVCKEHGCLVILDVSGGIGTKLCDGNYADLCVGSFGRWKPANAEVGGFVSGKNKDLLNSMLIDELEGSFEIILEKLNELDDRIAFLTNKTKKIKEDLAGFDIVHERDFSLVVVIKFSTNEEKEKIINYCKENQLEWTDCPRYIRLDKPAISIEVKRLN